MKNLIIILLLFIGLKGSAQFPVSFASDFGAEIIPPHIQDTIFRIPTFDGVNDYLAASHLIGSETVISSSGTSTPSVSAGRIDFTAGTCYDLVLSDGTSYPMGEGYGAIIFDVSSGRNNAVVKNMTYSTFWLDSAVVQNYDSTSYRIYHESGNQVTFNTDSSNADLFRSATIKATFSVTNTGSSQILWSLGTGAYRAYVTSGMNFYISTFDTGYEIEEGRIYNVTLDHNYNGYSLNLFIDDSLVVDVLKTSSATNGYTELSLGARQSGTYGAYMDGLIYDFEVTDWVKWKGYGENAYNWKDLSSYNRFYFLDSTKVPDALVATDSGRGFTMTGMDFDYNRNAWWCTNYGAPIDTTSLDTLNGGVVLLNFTRDSIILQYSLDTIIGANDRFQGITYNPSDSTLFICANNSRIYHITADGNNLLSTWSGIDLLGANGIAYDTDSNLLYVLIFNPFGLSRLEVRDLSNNVLSSRNLGQLRPDHIDYDSANRILWMSHGQEESFITPYYIDEDKFGFPSTLPYNSKSIEGLQVIGNVLYISNNGYYHQTSPINTTQRYFIKKTANSRNATLENTFIKVIVPKFLDK